MGVAVHRLVDSDLDTSREVVVLVPGFAGRETLEQVLKVAEQQGLVLVDGQADCGVQRLQMDPSRTEARLSHLIADAVGEVDELGGVRSVEPQAPRDHRAAVSA